MISADLIPAVWYINDTRLEKVKNLLTTSYALKRRLPVSHVTCCKNRHSQRYVYGEDMVEHDSILGIYVYSKQFENEINNGE